MRRLIITVKDGLIQSITTDQPADLEVVVLDFDTEGADANDLKEVHALDGTIALAWADFRGAPDTPPDGFDFDQVFAAARQRLDERMRAAAQANEAEG